MTGFFYNDNGYGLEFYHEAGREYSILFRIRPSTKEVDIPKNTENAIFKYPREKYSWCPKLENTSFTYFLSALAY